MGALSSWNSFILGIWTAKRHGRGTPPSDVQRPAKGVQRRLVHAFADRRVREDRGEEVGLGGFQGHGQGVALDHLGDIGADDVGADQGELR